MSFEPVDVAWMVPWYVKALYVAALVAVVVGVMSFVSRVRGRAEVDLMRKRKSRMAHLAFLLVVVALGLLTLLFRFEVRETTLGSVARAPADVAEIRRVLAREQMSDLVAFAIAVGGTVLSFASVAAPGKRDVAA